MIEAELPDGRVLEFPDGTDPAVIQQTVKRMIGVEEKPASLIGGVPFSKSMPEGLTLESSLEGDPNTMIGLGRGLTDFGEGIKQTALELGVNADLISPQELDQFNADAIEERQFFESTEAGQSARGGVGRIIGNVAPLAPVAPAGLLAASLAGGAQGATQFAETPGKRMQNTALGIALPAAIRGTGAVISETIRRAARGGEAGRRTLQETIDTFADVGASPTLGQGTGSRAQMGIQKVLKSLPGGGGTIERAAARTATALGNRATAIADKLKTGATAETAGRTVAKGIKGFRDRFTAKGSQLFNKVDEFISPTQPILVSNTLSKLQTLTTPTRGGEAFSAAVDSPKLKQMAAAFAEDAKGGILPYQALKEARSKVGAMLSKPDLISDLPRAELKQLYGALSDDMRNAAATSGPGALKAFDRANRHWKSGLQRIDDFLERLNKKDARPEDVFKAVMSGSKEGASTLRAVKKSLTQDEWREVSAATLKRMGRSNPSNQNELGEVFSAETFLTNWNRLDPTAQRALFSGPAAGSTAKSIGQLVKASAAIRESEGVLRNLSGTSPLTANIAATAAAGTAGVLGNTAIPGAILGASLFARLGAEALTNPRLIQWIGRATTIPANSLARHIASLSSVAATTDPEVQDEIRGFLESISTDPQAN